MGAVSRKVFDCSSLLPEWVPKTHENLDTALRKTGPAGNPANYRLAPFTGCITKLVAKLITIWFSALTKPILAEFQFGFRTGGSTQGAALLLQKAPEGARCYGSSHFHKKLAITLWGLWEALPPFDDRATRTRQGIANT